MADRGASQRGLVVQRPDVSDCLVQIYAPHTHISERRPTVFEIQGIASALEISFQMSLAAMASESIGCKAGGSCRIPIPQKSDRLDIRARHTHGAIRLNEDFQRSVRPIHRPSSQAIHAEKKGEK